MKLYFALLTALLSTVFKTNVEANLPVNTFKCYDQDGFNGRSFEIFTSITDTGLVTPGDFKGDVSSCFVNGIWLIYDGLGYAGNVEAINGLNTTYDPRSYGHKIKSVFWIGDSNTEDQVLLYSRPNFQGPGQPFSNTTLSVSRANPVESLILIGKTPYTIISQCESQCFEECHFCLEENKDGAVFIPTLTSKSMLKILEVHKGHCNKKSLLPGRKSIRKDCGCSPEGARNMSCFKGECQCKKGYHGKQCKCQDEYYLLANGTCQSCDCDRKGVHNMTCSSNGTCPCKNFYKGRRCDDAEVLVYNIGKMNYGSWWLFNVTCNGSCDVMSIRLEFPSGRPRVYATEFDLWYRGDYFQTVKFFCATIHWINLRVCARYYKEIVKNEVTILVQTVYGAENTTLFYKIGNFLRFKNITNGYFDYA